MRFPFLVPFLTASLLLASCGAVGPKYSLEELRNLYYTPLSNASLIEAAAAKGNVEHIKSLMHYDPTEEEIAIAYLNATENGHLDAVKFILNKYPDSVNWYRKIKHLPTKFFGPRLALINGHYDVAYYIVNNHKQVIGIDSDLLEDMSLFVVICEKGAERIYPISWHYDDFSLECTDVLEYTSKIKDIINIINEESETERDLSSHLNINTLPYRIYTIIPIDEIVRLSLDEGRDPNDVTTGPGNLSGTLIVSFPWLTEVIRNYSGSSGYLEALKLLLDKGADPNIEEGVSPISLAIMKEEHETLKLLVDYGACISNNHIEWAKRYYGVFQGFFHSPRGKAVSPGDELNVQDLSPSWFCPNQS